MIRYQRLYRNENLATVQLRRAFEPLLRKHANTKSFRGKRDGLLLVQKSFAYRVNRPTKENEAVLQALFFPVEEK